MSWLGDSFSSFTGHLTNITKEMLNEGREEVDDYATELSVANKQIQDLESQCNLQKKEVERLRTLNGELEERCQAAELQINAISSQYRNLLQNKEDEVNQLRQHSQQNGTGDATLPPLLSPDEKRGFDEADLVDLMSYQTEINRLAAEVRRLRNDRDTWKQLVDSQSPSCKQDYEDSAENGDKLEKSKLRTHIQELQQELQERIDEHQNQLTTLQDHYASQLHHQQEKHQQEIETLNDTLNLYKKHSENAEEVEEYVEVKRAYKEAHREIEQLRTKEKEREREIQLLNLQLDKIRDEKLQKEEACRSAQITIANLQQKMVELQNDHDRFLQNIMSEEMFQKDVVESCQQTDDNYLELKTELEEAKKKIEELETEKDKVCNDIYTTKLRFLAQLEAHHASTSEVLQDVQAAQQRINKETMDSHIRLLHEKEDIVGEMVQVNEQKVNLEKQLRSLQKNNSILASDVRKIIESLGSEDRGDILTLIARLDSETFALKSYNDQLSSCLSNLDKNSDCENGSFRQSVDGRRVENLMMDMSTSDDFDRESIASSMSELSMRNKELDVQVKGLQNQIETYEREIKYFELLHSDWQTERQAMEDLLLRLRAQLRMKEESLSVITAEKGLIAVKKKCPEEIQLKPPSVETEEFDTSDNLLERLEEQIEELMQVNAQFEHEKEVLKAENNALLEELSTLRNLRQSFDSKLDKSDNNEREPSKVDKIVMEKEEQIHALNSEKESLESSLLELDQQHQEEIEEFVNLKMTLTKSNKKLQSEIEELKYALEMKETENCQLKTEVETVREQLADLFEAAGKKSSFGDKEQDDVKKETVQSILNAFQAINLDNIHLEENITSLEEGRKELEDTIKELENKNKNLVLRNEELEMDVRDLRDENRQLSEKLQETEIAYDNQPVNEQNLEKLIEVEANYEFLKQENSNLKEELEKQHLKYTEMAQKHLEMQDSQSKIEISYEENCKKLEKVKAELSQKEDEIHALKDIKSANCNCSDKSIQVDFTIQDVGELQNELKVTQQKLLNCTKRLDSITDGNFCGGQQQTFDCSCDDLENWKERCTEKQMINYSCEEQKNGLVLENKEFYNLKENLNNSVADKENKMLEKIISDQKEELESLKKQFESANRSSKSVGNQYDDSKFRKSQEKIQQLEIEKEQMLAVLNEKSRECSNLKNEVHRLVNIVSAEKQAISKLQEDNQELIKQRDSPDQEMTKEAVQNLCRLVRDKDLEIEALNQKNGTLLAVIQQSSDSDHTKELLKQCETLAKQLGAYKADREQIINALNQKHQESLKYHAEVQKLKSLLEMETHKLNTLTHNHESVSQQYEEKQKSLVNTQNEVIGLKQRVSDLEKQHTDLEEKYRELLNRENGKAMANITKEELNKNYEELDKLKELVEEKDKWIFEKDQLIHGLSQDLQKLSDNFKQKENEVGILQKQTENLVLHLKETKDESNSTKERNQNLQQQLTNYQSEMNLMKELNERLNMTVQEKDFEIKALQEKVSTLTPMVQEKMNETGNMKQILMESDAMQQKAQHFHHERDEALLALSQRQQENEELKNEVQRLKEREKRLNNELERLRDHLLQVEESYTKEALKAEEREKELRNRLNQAEEQARMSSNAVHNANQHANMQLESLQEQLSLIVKQRDRAQNQVSEYEDKVQQYAASLANLQLVLEQFQKERERDIQILKKQHAAEVAKEKSKVKDLVMDIQEKEEQLSEAKEALDAASRLSEQLDTKEEVINSLKQEVSTITSALQKALEEIRDMKTNTEGKVDRQVMKSLVLGYFGAPLGQKPDVIRLLARVLDFSQEEMSKAGIKVGRESSQVTPNQRSKGWISGLFGKTPSPVPENQSRRDEREANKSFTALFVQFLQEESQPRFNVKLPAEEMARELAEKGHRPQRPPRINPFDPSVSSPTPTVTTRTNLDHPLIRPISSSLPTFTPILVTADEAASKSNTFLREVLN